MNYKKLLNGLVICNYFFVDYLEEENFFEFAAS